MTIFMRFLLATTLLCIAACGGDDDDDDAVEDPDVVEAEALLADVEADDYHSFDRMTGWEVAHVEASTPFHGDFIDIYVNDILKTAVDGDGPPFPDGSIVVKEGFTTSDATTLFAIAIMEKQGTEWFYAEYSPDGEVEDAGIDTAECLECHTTGTDHLLSL